MQYAKVKFEESFLSVQFLNSPDWAQGTYAVLMGKCSFYENDGVIKNCRHYTAEQWLVSFGVKKKNIFRESSLWWWEGDDLHIFWYPKESQEAYDTYKGGKQESADKRSETSRENGAKGGRPKKAENLSQNLTDNLSQNLTDNLSQNLTDNLSQNLNKPNEKPNNLPFNRIEENRIEENRIEDAAEKSELGYSAAAAKLGSENSSLGFKDEIRFDASHAETLDELKKRWNEIPHVKPYHALNDPDGVKLDLARRINDFGRDAIFEAVRMVETSEYFPSDRCKIKPSLASFLEEKNFQKILDGERQECYSRREPPHGLSPPHDGEDKSLLYWTPPTGDEYVPTEEELADMIKKGGLK